MKTAKQINVVTGAYEGDVPFPEADHYPEFVAEALRESYPGFAVDVSTGPRTTVHVYGGDESAIEHEISCLVKVDLWDQFCESGYREYCRASAEKISIYAADLARIYGGNRIRALREMGDEPGEVAAACDCSIVDVQRFIDAALDVSSRFI